MDDKKKSVIAWLKAGEPRHTDVALGRITPKEALKNHSDKSDD